MIADREYERLAAFKFDRIESRAKYERALRLSRIVFGAAALLCVVNASYRGIPWVTFAGTAIAIVMLLIETVSLTHVLPPIKRRLDFRDRAMTVCAFCGERPRAEFRLSLLAWPDGKGALTGKSTSLPVCLECDQS